MRGILALGIAGIPLAGFSAEQHEGFVHTNVFPRALNSYADAPGLWETLSTRVSAEPFNVIASVIFLLAIIHTFLAPYFSRISHKLEERHQGTNAGSSSVSFSSQVFHFLGEVEAVFGIWVLPLLVALIMVKDFVIAKNYLNHYLNFTEPLFVVVIMTIAASRPILRLAEGVMAILAGLLGGGARSWWFSILTVGPILGSFITEPAAMTISALLLSQKFYERKPSSRLAYASIGLLFVNISVGGTLTHFAAPPVLMVAGKWGWDLPYMFLHFGWKAVLGILISNVIYLLAFKKDFADLGNTEKRDETFQDWESRNTAIPFPIIFVHLAFLAWTVFMNHYPVMFIGGFLFYLAFSQSTEHHQNPVRLRPALMVGFFLAGLVIHGGLQGWWIQPVLTRLTEIPLFLGATILTAFNDNAAITYLAAQVPGFSEQLKYAVVAGAVTGGGLTVIANAPNPAGQTLLSRYFPDGVSPIKLALGAVIPTIILAFCFMLLR